MICLSLFQTHLVPEADALFYVARCVTHHVLVASVVYATIASVTRLFVDSSIRYHRVWKLKSVSTNKLDYGQAFHRNTQQYITLIQKATMDFLFPLLMDSCDPSNCDAAMWLDEDERRASRRAHLWRQDGMPSKSRNYYNKYKFDEYAHDDETGRSTRSDFPWKYDDDDSVTSYCPPKRKQDDEVRESNTEGTYPTTGTASYSNDSENSSWSFSTLGGLEKKERSQISRMTPSQRMRETPNYGRHTRTVFSNANYGIIEEPEICDAVSIDDSVGAVRISNKDRLETIQEPTIEHSSYAFDYIRKANNKLSYPALDPPSDKSVATSRSIRAEDAGSVLLRKGVVHPKNELARVLIARRNRDSQRLGPEP